MTPGYLRSIFKPIDAQSVVDVAQAAEQRARQEKLLGDYTKDLLEKAGITAEWYIGIKDALGFAPTCECHNRQEYLNKAHRLVKRKLGL